VVFRRPRLGSGLLGLAARCSDSEPGRASLLASRARVDGTAARQEPRPTGHEPESAGRPDALQTLRAGRPGFRNREASGVRGFTPAFQARFTEGFDTKRFGTPRVHEPGVPRTWLSAPRFIGDPLNTPAKHRGRLGLPARIALAAIVSQLASQAEPSLPWRWSNPLPHGNNIYDMAFHDGTYWQVTDRGRVYSSADRTVWIPVDTGTTSSLRSITFHGNEILICGESGSILTGGLSAGFQSQVLVPPTTDWLESIATSPTTSVAVGDQAAIYLRRDGEGLAWGRVSGLPFTDWLRGVAYGDGAFVTVGEGGLIATSADGISWKRTPNSLKTPLNRVVFVNSAFYACGDGGVLLRSTAPASSWDRINLGASETAYSYSAQVSSPGSASAFELVAGDLLLRQRTNPNGAWQDQLGASSPLPAPAWSYYTSVWDGTRFVVAGRTGMLVEGYRTDAMPGTFWFESDDSPREWLWDLMALPGQYIAVGDRSTVLTSENGIDWARESVPTELGDAVLLGIGGSSRLVVAAGSAGSLMFSPSQLTNIVSSELRVELVDCAWRTNTVLVTNSVDLQGLVWHPVSPSPTSRTLQGVAARDDLIVVVGDAGTVLTTTNAVGWTNRTISPNFDFSSVAAFPGGFVAVGSKGALFSSPDARTWQQRTTGTTNWVYRTRYLDGMLLAVGQGGLILTSANGLTWQTRNSGVTTWLTDIAKVGGRYYICGTQGTVLTSSDTAIWTSISTITSKSLYGLASRSGQLIAVGVEGAIIRALSEAAPPAQIIDYQHDRCDSFQRDNFLLSGSPDQMLLMEYSTNLNVWQPLDRIGFTDSDAAYTLLRTNVSTTMAEFFRLSPVAP